MNWRAWNAFSDLGISNASLDLNTIEVLKYTKWDNVILIFYTKDNHSIASK